MPFNPFQNVVVMYGRFGPYHRARLRAAAEAIGKLDGRVTGVEVARQSTTYAWSDGADGEPFEHITLMDDDRSVWEWSPDAWRVTQEALNRIGPSAVAVAGWIGPANLAALSWGRENGRPAIVLSDSKADDMPRRRAREWVKRFIVRQFDAALTASVPHRDYLVSLGIPAERIFYGADAIDNEWFAQQASAICAEPQRWRTALGIERPCFLAVSRLVKLKNFDRLIEAFAAYRQAAGAAAWDLAIVGSGPDEARLKALAERLAPGAVRFAGFLQIDDLPPWYALAECLVHPSLKETWGLVLNEAMASGLPVLASRTIGARADLIKEGVNGWSFDPEDTGAIAEALSRMASLPEEKRRAMGEASRRIVAQWGPERFADGLCQAIRAADSRAGTRRPGLPLSARLAIKLSMASKGGGAQ